jgi:hypothetical protein
MSNSVANTIVGASQLAFGEIRETLSVIFLKAFQHLAPPADRYRVGRERFAARPNAA